jgi:hypothetical protein
MRNLILSLWYRYKNWSYDRKVMKYFGCKPEKIYLSQEDYDKLVERINAPPDPEVQERLRKLLEREAPWDKQ